MKLKSGISISYISSSSCASYFARLYAIASRTAALWISYLRFYRYFVVHDVECGIQKFDLLSFESSCLYNGENCKISFARPSFMNSRIILRISNISFFLCWYRYIFSELQNNRKILKCYTSICTYGWYWFYDMFVIIYDMW